LFHISFDTVGIKSPVSRRDFDILAKNTSSNQGKGFWMRVIK
jgi:hypothetical protein